MVVVKAPTEAAVGESAEASPDKTFVSTDGTSAVFAAVFATPL